MILVIAIIMSATMMIEVTLMIMKILIKELYKGAVQKVCTL